MPSNHLILCRHLFLAHSIFPSIRVFSNESVLCIRWPKDCSFSFSISPSNEHPGLISFRMDWLDLPTVQGTLKSLLQHHSPKASVLWRSATVITIITVKLPRRSAKLLTWTMPGASQLPPTEAPKCPAGILRLGESRPPTRPSASWNLHSGLWPLPLLLVKFPDSSRRDVMEDRCRR